MGKRSLLGVLLALALVQVASAAGPAAGGKAMFQDNPQHTGLSQYAGPSAAALVGRFDTRQPGEQRADIQSAPVVGPDGTIYIGNFSGTLSAFRVRKTVLGFRFGDDRMDLVWQFRGQGLSSQHATPAVDSDGTVYLPFSDRPQPGQQGQPAAQPSSALYAFTAPASGTEPVVKWKFPLTGRTTSSPIIGPDGTIYQLAGSGDLFAIAPDGTKRWSTKVGAPSAVSSAALARDGTVYTLGNDGKLYAVQPAPAGPEAVIKWTFDYDALPGSPPPKVNARGQFSGGGGDGKGAGDSPTIGPDGTVYFGASNSNFYAVTPDGKLKWMFAAEREIAGIWSTAALSADGSTLYFGNNAGGVYALDAATGAEKWQFPVEGSIYAAPELDRDGRLYVGASVGQVWALDAAAGKPVWEWNAGQSVWTAPAITPDGALIVGTRDGEVWALESVAPTTLPRKRDLAAAGAVVVVAIG